MQSLPALLSPFEVIRDVGEGGGEFWSARRLMPLLGYSQWQNFTNVLLRAIKAAENQGYDLDLLFTEASKKTGGAPLLDYELSRFAAYLVAMNGDPHKLEVAEAQAYFAIRTREAEVNPPRLTGTELLAAAVLEAQSMLALKDTQILQLDARVSELEPKGEFYDHLMSADGSYSWQTAANLLGMGRNTLTRRLRLEAIIQANKLPYARYAHHFKVLPRTRVDKNERTVVYSVTEVLPTGLPFLRKRLRLGPVSKQQESHVLGL